MIDVIARAAWIVLAIVLASCSTRPDMVRGSGAVMIATWKFGVEAIDAAQETLRSGRSGLDAVEQGIRRVEGMDGVRSVGLSGRPNAAGYAQLDACIMNGPDHGAGSVAAVEGVVHPITLARRVMEQTKHVMLVGEGARWFALEQGLESVDISGNDDRKQAWRSRGTDPAPTDRGHDTVALLVLDAAGDLFGGCSTSGAGGKLPGRVGDSPILGSGLYVDNEVGAAGATGLGENIMRHCAAVMIVERMRAGMHPQRACEETIHRMARLDPRGYELDVCLIALDKYGRVGASASSQVFPYAVGDARGTELREVGEIDRR